MGIAETQKSLLFHKFQQLDSSYERQYTGAGVGLALTKQLVELHGGSIAVESTLGVGSVFTVRLPRSIAKQAAEPSKSPIVASRIVLIETHEETAELICDLLTAAEYQVIWLLDGASAIEQIEILQSDRRDRRRAGSRNRGRSLDYDASAKSANQIDQDNFAQQRFASQHVSRFAVEQTDRP
ncbi:MAG: hypothetical protein HC895_24830 [Leptolyngbyaceae cyanobacterium SM1_3_5]|nr:hypothetical protein [Leptolyngbyaceae cyanobacterium SM1_3_5]